jgi:adenylate cyclase
MAVSLDPNEPMAHLALGRTHLLTGDVEMAIAENQTAIAINANFARGHHGLGFAYYYGAGQVEQALPHFATALRLSPRDPWRWITLMVKGSALRFLGRYEEAIAHCRQACQSPDSGHLPLLNLAGALAEAGQKREALAAVERAMLLQPTFTISNFRDRLVGMHETCLNSYHW